MKTKEVFAIEKQLGFVLHETHLDRINSDWHQAYSLDAENNLVALSLKLGKTININFLKGLTHLKKLFLMVSRANLDLSFLHELPHLQEFDLSSGSILDTDALTNLQTLRKLSITYSKIKDAEFLNKAQLVENMSITYSYLSSDIVLHHLPNLHTLTLCGNSIGVLHLHDLPALTNVGIAYNPLRELTINQCDNLQTVDIYDTHLENLVFENLPALTKIDVSHTPSTALTISQCNNLHTTHIKDTKLESLAFENLPALTNIYIENNPLTAFTISQCDNLQTIRIKETKLENLALENLPALTSLSIENTPLQKIHMDKSFTLETFELVNCGVSNMDRHLLFAAFEKIITMLGGADLEERLTILHDEFEKNNRIVYKHRGKKEREALFKNPQIGKLVLKKRNEKEIKDDYYFLYAFQRIMDYSSDKQVSDRLVFSLSMDIKVFDFSALKHLNLSGNMLVNIDFLCGLSNLEALSLNFMRDLVLDADILESLPNLRVLNVQGVSGSILRQHSIPYEIAERGKDAVIAFLKQNRS